MRAYTEVLLKPIRLEMKLVIYYIMVKWYRIGTVCGSLTLRAFIGKLYSDLTDKTSKMSFNCNTSHNVINKTYFAFAVIMIGFSML